MKKCFVWVAVLLLAGLQVSAQKADDSVSAITFHIAQPQHNAALI